MRIGKHCLNAAAVLAVATFVSTSALGQVSARFAVPGGAATSTKAVPGSTFAMDLRIDAPATATLGAAFRVIQTTPATPPVVLRISARDFTGSIYDDTFSGTPDATVLATPSALLNPDNDDNLGRNALNLVAGAAPGTNLFVEKITFSIDPATPFGTYTITPTPGGTSSVTDAALNDYDMSATASFSVVVGQTLTVIEAGTGTGVVASDVGVINCPGTCSDIYPGTAVTLSATPNGGSTFAGWSGGGCSGTGTCVVTVNAATTVTATFNGPAPVNLTVTKSGTGAGTVTSVPAGINCGATCTAPFAPATVVTLTAGATAGSAFIGWTGGGCSGTGTCVVTMSAATSVNAQFDLLPKTLTVTKSGTGAGTVTSVPAGINCGATCAAPFTSGAVVTLTAGATAGSAFIGWTGGGCSGTGTCVVTMSAATSVNAQFDLLPNSLTVTKSGTGAGTVTSVPAGINCGATCTAPFAPATVVTLTAGATAGSAFIGWTGGGCSGTGTCVVTMSAATSVNAQFDLLPKTLTVTKSGTGAGTVTSVPAGINCGATCAAPFTSGAVVTLTAGATAGSAFIGWSGGGCSGTGTCVVTMSAATSVNAQFDLLPQSLTVTKSGTGTGTVTSAPAGINCGATCTAPFTAGTVVTLTAAATAGSAFIGWTGGGCSGTGTCVVTMSAATSVNAQFDLTPKTLTVTKSGTGAGTVTSAPAGINCGATCTAPFASGTVVTLTAGATAGSAFIGWTGGGCSGTGTCIVTMSAATSVNAQFDLLPNSLSVTKSGTGTGTVTSAPAGINCGATCTAPFAAGTVVTLTASATAGSAFSGWSGGGCSGTGTCVVTMSAPVTVTATFNLTPATLVSAVSRRTHGAAGPFDVPLTTLAPPAINHNPTTEPRQGPAHSIVLTFDKPITGATATITEGIAAAAAPTFGGNTVVVGLTGVADRQYVTVSLTNIAASDGSVGGSANVRIGFLAGDVNQTRVVSVADLGLVNAQLTRLTTAANFMQDVNASGTLTVADMGITNANLTRALPAP